MLAVLLCPVASRAHVSAGCISPPPGCPVPGVCIAVSSDLDLNPACSYRDVEFFVTASGTEEDPLVLDCGGKTLSGGAELPAAIDLHSHEHEQPLEHVTIRNCRIDGFKDGIKVYTVLSNATRAAIIDAYEDAFHEPKRQQAEVGALEVGARASAPQNLLIENVHVRGADNAGLYLYGYVHHVTFRDGSIRDSDGPGVYLDTGSRRNVIEGSDISENGREGIAVDSSAYNHIQNNTIRDNDAGGIMLYRNAWERRDEGQLPRTQHAVGNTITGNHFRDGGHSYAISIASRQSSGRSSSDSPRYDPVYLEYGGRKYYRDNAENTVVTENVFDVSGTGIAVNDDGAIIVGNAFVRGVNGISIGNRIRRLVGDPVRETTIDDNVFYRPVQRPVHHVDCSADTSSRGNRRGSDPYSVPPTPCAYFRATAWSHHGGLSGFGYRSTFDRLDATFSTSQRWLSGDFDGDGRDDLVRVFGTPDGQARVSLHLATASGFEGRTGFQTLAGFVGTGHWRVGDFDGDGRDDLVQIYRGARGLATAWVHLSTGVEFEYRSWSTRSGVFSIDHRWLTGDFDGDGKDDLANVFGASNGYAYAWTMASLGDDFEYLSSITRLAGFWTAQKWMTGDFDRDGRDDLVNVYASSGGTATAWTHRSTGRGFEYLTSLSRFAGFWSSQQWMVTDFDGRSGDDLVNLYSSSGNARVWRHASTGGGFAYRTGIQTLERLFSSQRWLTGDFDGDGRGDLLDVYGASGTSVW